MRGSSASADSRSASPVGAPRTGRVEEPAPFCETPPAEGSTIFLANGSMHCIPYEPWELHLAILRAHKQERRYPFPEECYTERPK